MPIQSRPRLFALLLVATLSVISARTASAVEQPRPNILWIFSEDLSPFMGCYDDPINSGHTPAIDGLASRGVLFKRAYVTAPVCSASRSAIITGVMQTTNGTHHHRSSRTTDGEVVPEALRINLSEGSKTLPEAMRESGYFTFNSGKDDYNFHYDRNSLYSVGSVSEYQPGMNGWQGNKAEHALSFTDDTWNARTDKSQPWFGQIELKGGKANDKFVRDGEKLKANDVPLPPYFPNVPAHRKSWTMHYNGVRGADAQVEQILEQLKKDGELENTIVFFLSDHGSNQSLRHKQLCYEGGVHVPLIIQGNHPSLKSGTVRDDLVSSLDVTVTTLALAGVSIPENYDGQDLFADDHQPRQHVISARDRCDYTIDRIRTVRTDKLRYIRNFFPDRPLMQAQYRDKKKEVLEFKRLQAEGKLTDYQQQHWFGVRPEEELYDLAADPHQINNLASNPDHAKELARHRQILNQWIKSTDDQGQYSESPEQLRATYEMWKDRPVFRDAIVNPEYDQFKDDGDASKPNIVLFFVDDMGWADLGFRNSKFETPNVDQLVKRGLSFEQTSIACPTCSPSRATLLTGLHPARMKLVRHIPNDPDHGFDKFQRTEEKFNLWAKDPAQFPCPNWLDLEYTTYAEAIKDLGYYNMFVGKWHLGHEPYHPIQQGFDRQYGTSNAGHPKGYYPPYFKNSEVLSDEKERYLTDKLTDGAVEFIQDYDREQPFMLSFWYYSVHGPHQGRRDLVKHFQEKGLTGVEAKYAAMVTAVDESIGRVQAALAKKGIEKETIIIFLSDQGGAFENPPFHGGKKIDTLYEGGARVPFVIDWPGVTQPETKNNSIVQSTDLFPTLIEMAGGDVSKFKNLDGVSLLSTIKDNSTLQRGQPVFGYRAYEDLYASVRQDDWKIVVYRSGAVKLFNLADDIKEQNDLSKTNPEVTKKLVDKLIGWEQKMDVQKYSGVQ